MPEANESINLDREELPEAIQIAPLPDDVQEYLGQFDFTACLTCNLCTSGCPITGTPGLDGMDIRKIMRLLALGQLDEAVNSKFPWLCTGCGRCSEACPMGIDIPAVTGHLKHLRPRDKVPGVLAKGVENVINTGNNMAVPKDDYLFLMYDIGVELAEEGLPGFYVPIDKKGAEVAFYPNSKEVFADNDDMKWWWKIFYAGRINWTIPLENWEAVDWGLFTGDYEATRTLARRKMNYIRDMGIDRLIMPDCGGGSYGCRKGMKVCTMEEPDSAINFIYLHAYLKELLETGRIKVDKSRWAGKTFTWHDSCKHGRELESHFGHGFFEEPRWIIQQCVDNFVDMVPNRMRAYCCGAGGGMWPGPYEDESAYQGRMKYESIKNSGANVVVTACSNCHDQMMKRLPKYYKDYEYEVMYLWELVAESLVFEPWTEEEQAKAAKEAEAQWKRLDFEPDDDFM